MGFLQVTHGGQNTRSLLILGAGETRKTQLWGKEAGQLRCSQVRLGPR